MKTAFPETRRFKEVLERKKAELTHGLRNREGMAIQKSADQMDEIQYAQERELATRTVDRESAVLREVHAALQRVHYGSFGTCTDCQWEIGPKRLAAVPWARRCINCQEAADRVGQGRGGVSDAVFNAA